jgi:hypothetical protein
MQMDSLPSHSVVVAASNHSELLIVPPGVAFNSASLYPHRRPKHWKATCVLF